jgi:structure-specific recognition protein 1
MSATLSTKGWNWGQYNLTNENIEFLVDSKKCFDISYKDIAISSANGKNEVALEFAGDET